MENWILWIIVGLPLLIAAGLAAWFVGKPILAARRLEARAAAGDPSARAAVNRTKRAEAVLERLLRGDDSERRRLLAVGRPARATIVSAKQLGLEVARAPGLAHVVEVVLALDTGGTVTVYDAVSELHLGRLLKGASVPIRVDPMDAQSVVVLWDAQ